MLPSVTSAATTTPSVVTANNRSAHGEEAIAGSQAHVVPHVSPATAEEGVRNLGYEPGDAISRVQVI